MKKVALTLASIAAFATFAPEASAIPAFARQVGMACSACHYQHFPVINAFGRAFKEGGYTMIGAEEKIEGDHLSIPAVENLAVIGYFNYEKANGAPSTNNASGANDGQLSMPQQVSLYAAGRGGENFGFEAEINLNGQNTSASPPTTPTSAAGNGAGTGTGNGGLIRLKVPFVVEAGGLKNLIIPFSTQNGVADSFEVLNTGAVNVHAFNQNQMTIVSAQQYINTGATNANGLALATSNDDFFANITKWAANNGDGSGFGPTSNYVRAAWTTDMISGFDSAIGFQSWSGSSSTNQVDTAGQLVDTKAFAVDAQMMGDVAGMPLLLVASYASAPASPNLGAGGTGNQNIYNPNYLTRSSFNIGAELGIVPNVATVQFAYRNGKSGQDVGTITGIGSNGQNATDNAVMIGATYALALNARLEVTYAWLSGDVNSFSNTAGNSFIGTQDLQIDLAFAF